jgi:hypothetical protein
MNQITLHQSAVVIMDYDIIYQTLKRYGIEPFEINFFPRILEHLKNNHELDVIEMIIYANFDDIGRHQTYLRQMGLTTRHCHEKQHGNLPLAIDTVRRLYENPHIDVFVLITGSNNIIELLKAIRYKDKFAFSLTLRENFDPVIQNLSDLHEFLDDLFGFEPPGQWKVKINWAELTFDEVRRARKITRLLYESHIWEKSETAGKPVSLKGYLAVIQRAVNEDLSQLRRAFEISHFLRYVTIYQINETFYLKRGERYKKVMKQENKP